MPKRMQRKALDIGVAFLPFPPTFDRGNNLSMKSVPQTSTEIPKNVARDEGDNEKRDCGYGIKWSDDINRANHMRPENEIDQWLRPAQNHQHYPEEMPSTD